MATTQSMFGDWKGFRKEIRRMFGDINKVKTAKDHLLRLKQTSSALTYYRRGLKSHVRIELARMENQPTDMVLLIKHTVRINNQLYKF
ncbi:hypothetical protein VE02_10353 [Pseudogymnoascus sp. 03VT05]|nr:hypothetical protein VE02_10353 [Pseudogymnoascus sp. 03VT05]